MKILAKHFYLFIRLLTLYIIDVSNQAREQGLIKTVCETVINVIKKGGFPENA